MIGNPRARSRGTVSRFDGWKSWGRRKASTGGGTWSGPGRAIGHADGFTTLWTYELTGAAAAPRQR